MSYDRSALRRPATTECGMPKTLVCVYVFRGKRKKNGEDYFHLHDQNKAENLFDYFVWLFKHDKHIKRIKFALYDDTKTWWVFDRRERLSWLIQQDFYDAVARSSLMLDLASFWKANGGE